MAEETQGAGEAQAAGEAHAEEAQTPVENPATGEEPTQVVAKAAGMPPMLAYTLRAPLQPNTGVAQLTVGQGSSAQVLKPSQPQDFSYWVVILDSSKPTAKLQEWVTQSPNAIPTGLDQYMSNPKYLFAVVTQNLSSNVPQGAWYDYLTAHGAGRELQKLEQISAYTLPPYGLVSRMAYVLTGQCGPGGIAYERGSFTEPVILELSLMPLPSGPPYSICDSYTFVTR
jgi:hypothetical protein